RDPDKLCLALQSGKRPAAAIAHPCTQSANELMNHRRDAAFVGDTPFDALGHELFTPGRTAGTLEVELVLEIAIATPTAHRADRPHAAILLEAPALVQDQLARTFVGPGKQIADHRGRCANGDGLRDVAGAPEPAV